MEQNVTQRRGLDDDAQIRSFIVAEVASQLKPFLDTLTKVHDWQISFWSNGNKDLPKGFFQRRMEDDDIRNAQIKADLKKQTEVADELVDYVKQQKFIAEHREKRWKFWWPKIQWALGGLASVILALGAWLGPRAVHVGVILWQDYLKYHPAVSEQIKHADAQPAPAVQSSQQKPSQDALQ
jgi:hypothetical protein